MRRTRQTSSCQPYCVCSMERNSFLANPTTACSMCKTGEKFTRLVNANLDFAARFRYYKNMFRGAYDDCPSSLSRDSSDYLSPSYLTSFPSRFHTSPGIYNPASFTFRGCDPWNPFNPSVLNNGSSDYKKTTFSKYTDGYGIQNLDPNTHNHPTNQAKRPFAPGSGVGPSETNEFSFSERPFYTSGSTAQPYSNPRNGAFTPGKGVNTSETDELKLSEKPHNYSGSPAPPNIRNGPFNPGVSKVNEFQFSEGPFVSSGSPALPVSNPRHDSDRVKNSIASSDSDHNINATIPIDQSRPLSYSDGPPSPQPTPGKGRGREENSLMFPDSDRRVHVDAPLDPRRPFNYSEGPDPPHPIPGNGRYRDKNSITSSNSDLNVNVTGPIQPSKRVNYSDSPPSPNSKLGNAPDRKKQPGMFPDSDHNVNTTTLNDPTSAYPDSKVSPEKIGPPQDRGPPSQARELKNPTDGTNDASSQIPSPTERNVGLKLSSPEPSKKQSPPRDKIVQAEADEPTKIQTNPWKFPYFNIPPLEAIAGQPEMGPDYPEQGKKTSLPHTTIVPRNKGKGEKQTQFPESNPSSPTTDSSGAPSTDGMNHPRGYTKIETQSPQNNSSTDGELSNKPHQPNTDKEPKDSPESEMSQTDPPHSFAVETPKSGQENPAVVPQGTSPIKNHVAPPNIPSKGPRGSTSQPITLLPPTTNHTSAPPLSDPTKDRAALKPQNIRSIKSVSNFSEPFKYGKSTSIPESSAHRPYTPTIILPQGKDVEIQADLSDTATPDQPVGQTEPSSSTPNQAPTTTMTSNTPADANPSNVYKVVPASELELKPASPINIGTTPPSHLQNPDTQTSSLINQSPIGDRQRPNFDNQLEPSPQDASILPPTEVLKHPSSSTPDHTALTSEHPDELPLNLVDHDARTPRHPENGDNKPPNLTNESVKAEGPNFDNQLEPFSQDASILPPSETLQDPNSPSNGDHSQSYQLPDKLPLNLVDQDVATPGNHWTGPTHAPDILKTEPSSNAPPLLIPTTTNPDFPMASPLAFDYNNPTPETTIPVLLNPNYPPDAPTSMAISNPILSTFSSSPTETPSEGVLVKPADFHLPITFVQTEPQFPNPFVKDSAVQSNPKEPTPFLNNRETKQKVSKTPGKMNSTHSKDGNTNRKPLGNQRLVSPPSPENSSIRKPAKSNKRKASSTDLRKPFFPFKPSNSVSSIRPKSPNYTIPSPLKPKGRPANTTSPVQPGRNLRFQKPPCKISTKKGTIINQSPTPHSSHIGNPPPKFKWVLLPEDLVSGLDLPEAACIVSETPKTTKLKLPSSPYRQRPPSPKNTPKHTTQQQAKPPGAITEEELTCLTKSLEHMRLQCSTNREFQELYRLLRVYLLSNEPPPIPYVNPNLMNLSTNHAGYGRSRPTQSLCTVNRPAPRSCVYNNNQSTPSATAVGITNNIQPSCQYDTLNYSQNSYCDYRNRTSCSCPKITVYAQTDTAISPANSPLQRYQTPYPELPSDPNNPHDNNHNSGNDKSKQPSNTLEALTNFAFGSQLAPPPPPSTDQPPDSEFTPSSPTSEYSLFPSNFDALQFTFNLTHSPEITNLHQQITRPASSRQSSTTQTAWSRIMRSVPQNLSILNSNQPRTNLGTPSSSSTPSNTSTPSILKTANNHVTQCQPTLSLKKPSVDSSSEGSVQLKRSVRFADPVAQAFQENVNERYDTTPSNGAIHLNSIHLSPDSQIVSSSDDLTPVQLYNQAMSSYRTAREDSTSTHRHPSRPTSASVSSESIVAQTTKQIPRPSSSEASVIKK